VRSKSGLAQLILLLGLPGCTASWDRVVQYSAEPAEHSAVLELYRTVLTSFTGEPFPDSVAVQDPVQSPSTDKLITACGATDVPKHWQDTLRREARLALSDPGCSKPADSRDLASAAHSLGVVLLPPDTTDWPRNPKRSPPPRIQLSGPGFNGDSTIAAVSVDVECGIQCGWLETLLLARRPVKRWRIWYSYTHVIA
jgi:hypothetical protein